MKRTISNPGPRKHVPLRTCIACREVKAKRELVRVVRTADGIVVDERGKVAGRGAYLCKARKCWREGLKGNRLEYVLHVSVDSVDRKRLEEYAAGLSEETGG
jgi:predicted RNA-binding protein YlxR (DUF448 family)